MQKYNPKSDASEKCIMSSPSKSSLTKNIDVRVLPQGKTKRKIDDGLSSESGKTVEMNHSQQIQLPQDLLSRDFVQLERINTYVTVNS